MANRVEGYGFQHRRSGSDSEVAGAGEFANVLTKWTTQLVMAGGGEVDDEEDTDDSVIGVQEFVWESLLPLK